MDPLHVTLLVLLGLAIVALTKSARDRARLTVERDVAVARLSDAEVMRTGFRAVAGEVLQSSTSEFLKLANETLNAKEANASKEFDQRKTAVDELIRPLQKAIEETRNQLQRSAQDSAGLREHVMRMTKSNQNLRSETSKLSQALRKPNVRGRYGEIQLERVVELAGMRSYCDFTSQESLRDADGKLQKPDLVVRLPNGRMVAIDAKTPLDAYMDALSTDDVAEQEERLDRYARNVAEQVTKLANKEYWTNFEGSPELVVMFIPGDQLVDAALERRPELIDLAAQSNVVIASPSTLIGLLRAIHVGWRERNLTDNAEELFRVGRELHSRVAIVVQRASKLGDSLESARKNYNQFVGSVQTRLIPAMRKFEAQDARSTKTIEPPSLLEEETRKFTPQELVDDTLTPVEQ